MSGTMVITTPNDVLDKAVGFLNVGKNIAHVVNLRSRTLESAISGDPIKGTDIVAFSGKTEKEVLKIKEDLEINEAKKKWDQLKYLSYC